MKANGKPLLIKDMMSPKTKKETTDKHNIAKPSEWTRAKHGRKTRETNDTIRNAQDPATTNDAHSTPQFAQAARALAVLAHHEGAEPSKVFTALTRNESTKPKCQDVKVSKNEDKDGNYHENKHGTETTRRWVRTRMPKQNRTRVTENKKGNDRQTQQWHN